MAYSKDELYEQRKEVTDKLERLSEEKNKFNNRWDEIDECLNRDVVFFERILFDENYSKRTTEKIEELLAKTRKHLKANEDSRGEVVAECDRQNRELEEELYRIDYEIENAEDAEE